MLPNYGGNPSETYPKSNAAARRALELDPLLAHPHAVLGSNEMEYDWDFPGGEAEYRKAPCERTAKQECADCGAAICDLHAELCTLCRRVFCGSCLFQHMKEPHAKPAVPILDERIQKRPA